MHGVERRAQLVRHAREELRLVPAGDLELVALRSSSSRNSRALSRASADWLAKVCEQVHDLLGEVAGQLPPDDERPDDPVLAEHRHGQQRPPPVVEEDPQVRVEVDRAEIGDGDRATLLRGPADQRRVEVDAYVLQPLDHLGRRPVDAAHQEAALGLVVLHDRAAVGAGQLDGVRGDGGQHLVQVEGRADRLADLAERLELVHLPRELGAPLLHLLDQLDAVDRHRSLSGERGEDRHLPLVERADVVAPERPVLPRPRRRRSSVRPSWCGTRRRAGGPGGRTRGRHVTSAICWARPSSATRPISVSRFIGIGCSAM